MVCLTQQQIDRYGAILPQAHGDCKVNLVKKPDGMVGNMVCTGTTSYKAAMQFEWSDGEHATGSVHFVGTILVGATTLPMEWTTGYAGSFKSADCGNVKP